MARIYLVEDDFGLSEPLAGFLTSRGHRVYAFDSGTRALEFLRNGPRPDVILLDLLLRSDMNGWQFAEQARQLPTRNVPIIAMSAAPLTDAERRQCRADVFLAKPFSLATLLSLIELLADESEAREAQA